MAWLPGLMSKLVCGWIKSEQILSVLYVFESRAGFGNQRKRR